MKIKIPSFFLAKSHSAPMPIWSVNEFNSSFPQNKPTFLIPEFTTFDKAKSIILYDPPTGIDAKDLTFVKGLIFCLLSPI